ncbi:MAG: SRPBCC domain-containing protein, partial [Chitinophagales bacterium]
IEIIPEKLLLCNYWSGFSGLPDVPENYQNVRYELSAENGGTKLSITQDNIPSEESKTHSEQNWKIVLDEMRKLLEQK